jgi:hypothetical protein
LPENYGRSLGVFGHAGARHADVALLESAPGTAGPYRIDVETQRDAPTPVEPFARAKAHWSYQE